LCGCFVPTENIIKFSVSELHKVFFLFVQPTKVDPPPLSKSGEKFVECVTLENMIEGGAEGTQKFR
jgi:hypothetical protein